MRGHHPLSAAKKPKIWLSSIQQEHDYAAKTRYWKNLTKRLVSLLVNAHLWMNQARQWGKLTADKCILESVKGANIDVNNVKKVPLNDLSFSERFSQTVISLIQKEINRLLKKGIITEVSGMKLDYFSQIFLREKKDNKHRLVLNLLNLFLIII